ncbi:hypothetical protein MTO96_046294 [Rhipicephalus appendiculatus]
MVAMGFGGSGSPDTPLGGRPRGRLTAEASLEGSAVLSSAAAWHLACQAFGGPRLALSLLVRHGVVAPSLGPTSALDNEQLAVLFSVPLTASGPRGRLFWNSGESPD